MDELAHNAADLQMAVTAALNRIGFSDLRRQQASLAHIMHQPDFWADPLKAQQLSKQHAALERRLTPWHELKSNVDDLVGLAQLGDSGLHDDLVKQLGDSRQRFEELKHELRFAGPYDQYSVILSIYAGAGGTDAQDWAQMLLRMYIRWAEANDMIVKTIDESAGEEAGIKSVTCEIDGNFAYGKLKGEHGVHRLVRLSPFNADHLRQTSFARVEILPKIDQLETIAIDEKDLRIDVYRSSGHGGQSVNTTDSAVRITHLPTGIVVAIQNERSQLQNKEMALTILRSKLAQMKLEQHQEKIEKLKGPSQSAEWGNQIRSYVLHPYKQVKDLRTRFETSDIDGVLDGNLDILIEAYLEYNLSQGNISPGEEAK
ncbi:MAG TPA: peptide chain release factor 2 [Candidatus Saccharimonadales bacterium]|nr:peptide chain release factor 2 [Candidatus Saccharimonadales bacterium]